MLRRSLGVAGAALALVVPATASAQLTTTSSTDLTPRVKEYVGTSVALNGTTRLRVILPTGYAENPTRRYPVLYLLHGAFDDYRSWVDKGFAERVSEPHQMIIVMPDGGTFGWYANHVNNGPQWETFHIGELIPWADATFRTKPERSERAIAGLSMGGHGTAAYSGRHPDLFAAAEAFSGVVNPTQLGPGENVFGPKTPENIARWEGSDGTYLIPNYRTYAHFGLRTGTGQPGPFDAPTRPVDTLEQSLYAQNTNMHNKLTAAGIAHTWEEFPGTHTWPYWERDLGKALPEFQRVFDGDVATPAQVNVSLPDNQWTRWGWSVGFDSARPLAWTTLARADATGFTLTGKGAATVKTPAGLYPAGKQYKANGAAVTAAQDGSLTIPVDLGTGSTVAVFVGALSTELPGTVGGTVPATLSLTLGAPATFGTFTPGVEQDYTATTDVTVTSTAGDAALSATPAGKLTNGAFSLVEPLRVEPAKAAWNGPTSGEKVGVTFKQLVKRTDPLRTGSYSTTVTFTLSTTNP
ncbi:alpha/beta hydrolase-fold protein [Solirubrobacter phytolaccae]|uniref:Alpha/beta hydrolase-fold protein n=1 Tax=Solirubrobacter phytolaccae TaxID=1404360 RepID=A0A9X3NDY0_9ACTN|nr:alpha/beta hydrolase-fold protein [Solirubrobacter phytolaccae]MDA0183127.1 alpha/beta hydrolase-fold protein [Solirubrobacter phytolaccae]